MITSSNHPESHVVDWCLMETWIWDFVHAIWLRKIDSKTTVVVAAAEDKRVRRENFFGEMKFGKRNNLIMFWTAKRLYSKPKV